VSDTIRSVLHDIQESQGATFRDDSGWFWTDTFGNHPAGYEAVRRGVAIWDVYPLVKWDVSGPDATAAIQRVFTRDLAAQKVGQVRYGAFVDEAGLLVDDGTVYKHSDDHYWVLTNSDEWDEYARSHSPTAQFTATLKTHDMPLISVQGPKSRELLQSLTDADLSGVGYFTFLTERATVAGVPAWIARTGFSGEIGFELIPDRDGAVALWSALSEAGAVPMGLDTLEPVRIEAGLVIYYAEYTPGEQNPYDLSMDRLVALDSPADFLGKEQLAAWAAAPPQRLKTLLLAGTELPEDGADVVRDGGVIGTLTSRTVSPEYGTIALARLATEHAIDGTAVEVACGSGTVSATVAPLSVKDPEKRLPRG
jgi:glycine cleavage system T protein (aminomethyltransferase)